MKKRKEMKNGIEITINENFINDLKFCLAFLLCHLGDLIYRLSDNNFLNGCFYSAYNKCMLWSVDLDVNGRVWGWYNSYQVRPYKNKWGLYFEKEFLKEYAKQNTAWKAAIRMAEKDKVNTILYDIKNEYKENKSFEI